MQQIFLGILLMWGIHVYAIWTLTCVFFTKCEILVRNMWRIGTNFSCVVRNWYQFFTVWHLRSVKFEVQHCCDLLFACWVILHVLSSPDFFQTIQHFSYFVFLIGNTIRVSNSLDPDKDRYFVGPYLGLKLFAKVISRRCSRSSGSQIIL